MGIQRKAPNLCGRVFGRLTVISRNGTVNGRSTWNCLCSCGNHTIQLAKTMISGSTKSCGCLQRDIVTNRNASHGMVETGAYISWAAMIQRCTNPRNPRYMDYGGRGIHIAEKWLSFEGFHADMGDRPEGHSIERVNNDGDYCKENCIWIPRSDQAKNRRHPSLWDRKIVRDKMGRFIKQMETI